MRSVLKIFLLAALTLAPLPTIANGQPYNTKKGSPSQPHPALKGWDYLFATMVEAGMSPDVALKIISDERFPRFDLITFRVKPKESPAPYVNLNTPERRKNALEFYQRYPHSFEKAEQEFGIPKSVLLSIIQIETGCGKNFGNHSVLIRLSRWVGLADPQNVVRNFEENNPDNASLKEFKQRAAFMEETFLPHLIATYRVANDLEIDPFELKGSVAGAIGYPQFMPGNVALYGVDGNGDGKINLFEPEDAIPSVGKFLSNHGWRRGKISLQEKRKALGGYNNSDPYINTVLQMAASFDRVFKGSNHTSQKTRSH